MYVADYYINGCRKVFRSDSFERCLSVVLSSDINRYAIIVFGYVESSLFFPINLVYRRSVFSCAF